MEVEYNDLQVSDYYSKHKWFQIQTSSLDLHLVRLIQVSKCFKSNISPINYTDFNWINKNYFANGVQLVYKPYPLCHELLIPANCISLPVIWHQLAID